MDDWLTGPVWVDGRTLPYDARVLTRELPQHVAHDVIVKRELAYANEHLASDAKEAVAEAQRGDLEPLGVRHAEAVGLSGDRITWRLFGDCPECGGTGYIKGLSRWHDCGVCATTGQDTNVVQWWSTDMDGQDAKRLPDGGE